MLFGFPINKFLLTAFVGIILSKNVAMVSFINSQITVYNKIKKKQRP